MSTIAPTSTHVPLYLLIYRPSPSQRAHFALWIPHPSTTSITCLPSINTATTSTLTTITNANSKISNDLEISSLKPGTKIHVVGAPMTGFVLSFVRNYIPSADPQNPETVRIGEVEGRLLADQSAVDDEVENIEHEKNDAVKWKEGDRGYTAKKDIMLSPKEELGDDAIPRGELERAAKTIPVPGVSRNFLAAVDDKTNRRCQEWTMDFLRKLVELGYIDEEAVAIVQGRRDPPSFGIGLRRVGNSSDT